MKTAIIYCSKHHENTKKLIDAIAAKHEITLINAEHTEKKGLTDYDLIGFASGIYYSKFHKSVLQFAKDNLPSGKQVFFLYTCGAAKDSYTKAMSDIAAEKKCTVKGSYGCLGFDTYGPFKLIGGMAKGHPDEKEIADAVKFYEGLL